MPSVSSRVSAGFALSVAVSALARPVAAHDFVQDSAPMRWVEQAMTEDLPPLKYPAYFEDLDKAKAQVHAGRYKTALLTLRKIENAEPNDLTTIALLKGRALFVTGRTDEALRVLSDSTALQPILALRAPGSASPGEIRLADDPHVQLLRAEILAESGRADEALREVRAHLKQYPDSWGGHYWAGEIAERLGDTDAAKKDYAWFVEEPQNLLGKWTAKQPVPEFEDAQKVTWMGRAIDRWATLNEKYRNNSALPRQILNIFVKAREVDANWWPAQVAAAEYFMERDDNKQAMGELSAALDANPQDVRALRLVGKLSLSQFDFNRADAATYALRQFDPNSVTADLLEARNLMQQRLPKDAETPIQRVLSAQPRNLEALGLLAATYALQLEEEKADQILAQVDAIDVGNNNASAYLEVAEQLGAMRQYPRAAAKYKVAIERAPWWTAAWNGLGLLYTQSGDEAEAHAVINSARELDPFNLETTNYQKLLKDMDAFERVETEHFVVTFDKAQDPILGEYLPEYLESIHAQICSEYKTEPAVKTFIEVFPSHAGFSVRTTGSPWIGTVGASTGRVIALVSPRKGKSAMEQPFNWAQVLRHEYTHTVTLAATDNRIQHWMTEGLAVLEERSPIRWEWVPMLYNAVKNRELFTMDNLTWGFIRPKKPTDRSLAYAQSWWVCKYVQETYGHDAILKMLDMFKNAGRMEDVFPAVTGKPINDFYKEFLAWCDDEVAAWGYDEQSTAKYDTLREQAEALMKSDPAKAITLWQKILFIRPVDAMPHTRLAGLYLLTKQNDQAIAHLEALHKVAENDNRYAKTISKIYAKDENWPKSADFAKQAIYIDPYDLSAHELMKSALEKTGDEKGLVRENRVMALLKQWAAAKN